jgi:hypothetical protein
LEKGGFMLESSVYKVLKARDAARPDELLNEIAITRQVRDLVPKQRPVFSGQQSGKLVMDDVTLDRLLIGRSSAAGKFARRRLKLLFDRCSKDVQQGRISVEAVNRLSTICLDIIPLIESERIVMPTAAELSILFNWYLDRQARSEQEPGIVLTTVCPDYPYEWTGTKAIFKNGTVGNDIGLVGESIMKTAPHLLNILAKSLNMSFVWIVGYAGFEAKPENLENMNISAEEFRDRLETSAFKLQQKLDVPVVILPDALDLTVEQFNEIREGFIKEDFNIRRKGMDALADAVDARDWASVFTIANRLNAIIVDGASVYMGRRAYKKAAQILQPTNHTPCFYCVCNYMGFAE